MPTNDERRQVAAKLREKYGERLGTIEPQDMYIQAMNRLEDIFDCLPISDCLPKRRDMLLDLADLIDPTPDYTVTQVTNCCPCGARATCTVLGTILHEYEHGQYVYEHELSCGHVAEDHYGEPPNFCSECGSMVVAK